MTFHVASADEVLARGRGFQTTRAFYEHHASEYAEATVHLPPAPGLTGFISRLNPQDAVVDLGCGSGRDLKLYRESNLRAVGLDYSYGLCVLARQHSGAAVAVGDILQLPFSDASFQGVSAIASLLHFGRSDIADILAGIHRVLAPEGLLFSTLKRGVGDGQDQRGRWFSYFEPTEWESYLRAAGFVDIEVQRNYEQRDSKGSLERIEWLSCICRKSRS